MSSRRPPTLPSAPLPGVSETTPRGGSATNRNDAAVGSGTETQGAEWGQADALATFITAARGSLQLEDERGSQPPSAASGNHPDEARFCV